MKVTKQIVPLQSSSEYRKLFNLFKTRHPKDKDHESTQETKQVIISWELDPWIRAKDPIRHYYGPYIIVIPPKDNREYVDDDFGGKSYIRSVLYQIVMSILKDYPEYDWTNLESFGWFFHENRLIREI
ncbi:hypothetical protein [Desulfosporosinus sp. OT]|uniref:hypothetical protein n=1 Tax=Desulfosporosinus sp. OT TaxID=913865 RepID=UPI001FA7BF5C|nr:hypothetical protein [Desulfosporosinus sp. OT]